MPDRAKPAVGAGEAIGVTLTDGSDAGPVPTALAAVTVNVYDWPLLRPVTAHESGPLVQVQVLPSGCDVTA